MVGLCIGFGFYVLGLRSSKSQTIDEGRKTRKKIRKGFSSIEGSQRVISDANNQIQNDTLELRKLTDSIHFKLSKIFEIKSSGSLSLQADLEDEMKKYEQIINSLEVRNTEISRENQESKRLLDELVTNLVESKNIEKYLLSILSNNKQLSEKMYNLNLLLQSHEQLLTNLYDENIKLEDVEELINGSLNQLTITKRNKVGNK